MKDKKGCSRTYNFKKKNNIPRLFTLFKKCINSGSESLSNNLMFGGQL